MVMRFDSLKRRAHLSIRHAKSQFEFCIPTIGKTVPAGPEWFHEIKYDGYRLRVERDADRVRLITRGGYDWPNASRGSLRQLLGTAASDLQSTARLLCFALMVCPISTPCIQASIMERCNSAHSTCWRLMVTTCATCRFRCGRPTLSGFSAAVRMVSSSIHSRAARSGPIYSEQPATWG